MRSIVIASVMSLLLTAPPPGAGAASDPPAVVAGDLDSSFSGDGIQAVSHASQDMVHDVEVDEHARVYLAGESPLPRPPGMPGGTNWAWTVSRLTEGGDLDPTFAEGGTWTRHFGVEYAAPQVIVPQPDGTVLVGGYHSYATGSRRTPVLVRLTGDGRPDPSFGQAGVVTRAADATLISSTIEDMVVLSDGRILTVGQGRSIHGNVVSVARHLPDGGLDPTFGTGGQVLVPALSGAAGFAVDLDAGGRAIVAGTAWDGRVERVLVLRLTGDGLLDESFADGGRWTGTAGDGHHQVGRVSVQADGTIVVSGHAAVGFPGSAMLVRLTGDGTPDPSFGDDGVVLLAGMVQAADHVTTTSTTTVAALGPGNRMVVMRVLGDGTPDPTFATGGRRELYVNSTWGRAVTLDHHGRLVIAGHSGWDLSVVRMHALTSCELSLDVPAVVAPDDELVTATAYREMSGRAPTLEGITITTTATPSTDTATPPWVRTAVTDRAGISSGRWVLPPGEYDVSAVADPDDRFRPCASATVSTVVRGRPTLHADAVVVAAMQGRGAFTATLTGAAGPLVGRTLEFTTPAGRQICTAATGADGRASCPTGPADLDAVVSGYHVQFAGDVVYEPASATASTV